MESPSREPTGQQSSEGGTQLPESKRSRFMEPEWFRQSPDGPVLLGSKCRFCGKVLFPQRRYLCLHCLKEGGLEPVPISRAGKLHTYAVQVLGAPGFASPYAIGWIELPEGIKLFSLLTDCEPFNETLKIGMDMEMVIGALRTIRDEQGEVEIIGYKFRPILSGRDENF